MAKFFAEDNPFNAALTKIFDLCVLNVCALICCVPIVTAGASMTALYAVMLPMSENKEGPIIKSFIRQFRANLKGSVKTWLVMLFAALVLMFDLYVWTKMESSYRSVFFGLTIAMLTALAVVASWYFGLRATFEDTGKTSLINAGKYALIYLPASILMAAYTAGIVYVYLQQGYLALFIPIFGITLIEYPKAWYMRQKFNAYIADHSDIYGVAQEEDPDEAGEAATGTEEMKTEEKQSEIGMEVEEKSAEKAGRVEDRTEKDEKTETGKERVGTEEGKKENTQVGKDRKVEAGKGKKENTQIGEDEKAETGKTECIEGESVEGKEAVNEQTADNKAASHKAAGEGQRNKTSKKGNSRKKNRKKKNGKKNNKKKHK